MSFGGHALDMIKRLKEGREPLKRRRENAKDRRTQFNSKSNLPEGLTAEAFEKTDRELKKHKAEQERSSARMMFMSTAVLIIATILLCLTAKWLFF